MKDTQGVRPFLSLEPLLQQKDLINREFRWLIPMGVKYLMALWENESTDSRIVNAVLDYAMTWEPEDNSVVDQSTGSDTSNYDKNRQSSGRNNDIYNGDSDGHEDDHNQMSNTHFYSSPYELLMTLDVARRYDNCSDNCSD